MGVTLRMATDDDAEMLWRWANDPEIRGVSFTSAPIGFMEHARWFDKHRGQIDIIERDGVHVGMLRIDNAEVSIIMAPEHRDRGLGTEALTWAGEQYRGLRSRIKPDNERSLRAFSKAGFVVDHIVMRHD